MRKYLFFIGCSFAFAAPALAEDSSEIVLSDRLRDESITVLATGSPLYIGWTGQPASIIGADELQSVQGPDLTRTLERLPGVTLARNGGLGSTASLFVRGASSEQLLVLVDGVRVNDIASPGGGYDFGTMLAGGIGKVELLRGANSLVWGSNAIAGVLALTTREFNGVEASAEYGAHRTFDGQANAGLESEAYAVNLAGGYTHSRGISAAAAGSEADGFRQWRIAGKGRVRLAEGLAFEASARHADSRTDIDGYIETPPGSFNYVFTDSPEYQESRETSGWAGLHYFGSALELRAGYAISDNRRAYFDPRFDTAPNFETHGRSDRAEVIGTLQPGANLRLDFGADSDWSRFSTTFDERHTARLSSAHALLGWTRNGVSLAAGARIDDHSRFGSEWTFGANGSIMLGDGWRVRASYGEGFKAPTLYQLYSDYGNLALAPERSRSFDAGIEKGDRNAGLHLAVTAFRRDSRNLIDYVSCFSVSDALCEDGRFGFYANVARARAQGLEVELGAQVSERVRAAAVYFFVEATNRTRGSGQFGNALARRPRHAVTASVDWETPFAGLALGADVRMVGASYDDAGNFTRLDGYALGTVRASLPVSDAIELFGRVENVTDASYQTAAGYATAGRSVYVGARARF